jgi:hypothetical protein
MDNRKLFQRAKTVLKQMSGIRDQKSTESVSKKIEEKTIEIPEEFFCPISQEVMRNPVKTSDGYTYEYKSIAEWLESHDTSPLTNDVLPNKELGPNLELKKIIEQFEENQRIFSSGIPSQKQALLKTCIISQSQIQLSLSDAQERLMQAREEIKQNQLHAEKLEIDIKETRSIMQKQETELKESRATLLQMNNELKEKNLLLEQAELKEIHCKIVLKESLAEVRDKLKQTNDERINWEKSFFHSQKELEAAEKKLASIQGIKKPSYATHFRRPFFSNPKLKEDKYFKHFASGNEISLPVHPSPGPVKTLSHEERESSSIVARRKRCC